MDFWKSLRMSAMLMVSGTYFMGFMMSLMANCLPLNMAEKKSFE